MSNKSNVWYQIKILGIVLTVILFLAFFWIYQCKNMVDTQQTIVLNWSKNQYRLVEELVSNAKVSDMGNNFDHFLMETLVPKLRYTDMSYGFLYKEGTVLFEQNSELTRQYLGNTIRNTYGAFSYYGGEHLLEVLEKMESKISGTDYFVKDHFNGREWVTWIAFEYEGNSYIMGIATPEVYILNEYHFFDFRNETYAFSGVYTMLFILFSGMLCFFSYRYKETVGALTEELVQKKQFIQKEKNTISDLQEQLKQLTITDLLTGTYHRKYFDVLVGKLKDQIFLPISICIFDIDGFKAINDQWGHEKGDEILQLLAETCKELCDNENDVIARYGNDEIIVLMINTPCELALEKAKQIVENVAKNSRNLISAKVSYGVSTKVTESYSIYQTMTEAEEKLRTNSKHETSEIHGVV